MQDVKEEKTERYTSLREANFLELSDQENRQRELLRQQRQWLNSENYAGDAFTAKDLLTKNQSKKVILLGAPGSGKTTLMSYFSVIIAQDKAESLGLNPEVDWLPILIRMRDYVRKDDLSILEYYRHFCQNSLSIASLPEGFFEHWLQDGRALILLDGLDEVVEEGKRHEIVQKIENFLGSYDQNRVIITSRPAGYKRNFFRAEEFPHYVLQPFDEPKINRFIENWYDSRSQDQEDAKRLKEDIRKAFANNPHIHHLARNPLLLTIITLIHRYQAQLPRERYKLYQSAIETLLTTWDTTNKQLEDHHKLEYLKNDDWEDLMRNLAYWIHAHQDGIEGNKSEGTLIDKNKLIIFLTHYIEEKKKIEYDYAENEAKRFISFVRDRSGLLNEQGTDCYAFVHKTFQEYLCAQKIRQDMKRNRHNFQIILDAIKNHLHDAHWQEVLLLLVAQEEEESAAEAIRVILNNQSDYEQWLHRDLLLAGSCLAENPKGLNSADGDLVKEILEQLVNLESSKNKRNILNLNVKLYEIFCSLYETDFAPQCLSLLKAQTSKIDSERLLIYSERLLIYRAELGEKQAVIEELLQQLSDKDRNIRENAATGLAYFNNIPDDVIDTLLAIWTEEEDEVVCWQIAELLGNLEDIPEKIIKTWLNSFLTEDIFLRCKATKALGYLRNPTDEVINRLIDALQDENDRVREKGAETLEQLELLKKITTSEKGMNALVQALSDKNVFVRQHTITAVGNLDDTLEKFVDVLLLHLLDYDFPFYWAAINSLSKLISYTNKSTDTTEKIVATLSQYLSNKNQWDDRQEHIAFLLGKLGRFADKAIDTLLSLLLNENHSIRQNAIRFLGFSGITSNKVIQALLKTLTDDSENSVRVFAAGALINLGNISDQAIDILLLALSRSSDNHALQVFAVKALGKLTNPPDKVINILLAACLEKKGELHGLIIDALINLANSTEKGIDAFSTKKVIEASLETLSESENNSFVRFTLRIGLRKLGKRSSQVLPLVVEWIQENEDSKVVGNGIDILWDLVIG
jgi:HEAT repeat protein/energy-coupling factor transporter ATP-binding protein EcfA2